MATYKKAGVNIAAGDESSALAYAAAKATFGSRAGMIGKPVALDGGFSGALDFGAFYLVMNSDGVGSKVAIADAMKKWDTLGYDLLAMVVDDAICVGAETVAITNTVDTNKVDPKAIGEMMKGLKKACIEQKVVVPGGEIAELPGLANGNLWNSTSIGIVDKKRFLTGKGVKAGDTIVGLRSRGFRSNGISLVRYVLKKEFGAQWWSRQFSGSRTWGSEVLKPARIYSAALLDILGRFGEAPKAKIRALAHVTGGGVPGNVTRVLGGFGAEFDALYPPHAAMKRLQELGNVKDKEVYKTWNMGTGMLAVCSPKEVDKLMQLLKKGGIDARPVGVVTKEKGVRIKSEGFHSKGKVLTF